MNQNENASWNIVFPNNRGQFPIDSQAAGISQHHRQSRHINHLKGLWFNSAAPALGKLCLLKLAELSNSRSVHPSGKI